MAINIKESFLRMKSSFIFFGKTTKSFLTKSCSDRFVSEIDQLSVSSCDCNTFGVLLKDHGTTTDFTTHYPAKLTEGKLAAFDSLGNAFAAFMSEFDVEKDKFWNIAGDVNSTKLYEDFVIEGKKMFETSNIGFAKKTLVYALKSAVIGLNKSFAISNNPNEVLKEVICDKVVAHLFGFKNIELFKLCVTKMMHNFTHNFDDAAHDKVENKLKYNGSVYTENDSYISPYAFKDKFGNVVLAYVIVDTNGIMSMWISDIETAIKMTDETITNQIKVYGRCELFELPVCNNAIKFFRKKIVDRKNLLDTTYEPIEHNEENILEVNALKQYFPIKAGFFKHTVGYVRAVDGITFNIKRGTTMGLVGESGCGKTTTGRTILRLYEKTGGQVLFNGHEIFDIKKSDLRKFRPKIQIVFQDPYSSLSPRLPVAEIIGEAVKEHKIVPKEEYDDYLSKIMKSCGLQEYYKDRYPHEFSGGQRQRICIARALALNPEFIVCDEPVSALDVSIQAQIINLLRDLQQEYGLTYLFISHDLSVVEHISDTVGVMYLGDLVEYAPTDELFKNPDHPYTKALFSAIPIPDPTYKMNRIILEGSIPSPANPPSGCKFHTRCKDCMEICKWKVPPTIQVGDDHYVKCHLYSKESMETEATLQKDIQEEAELQKAMKAEFGTKSDEE